MKASVWTKRDIYANNIKDGAPKCIFIGEIQSVPRIGEYVIVRDGYGAERVEAVIHDFVRGEIEISVATSDCENSYGGSLF